MARNIVGFFIYTLIMLSQITAMEPQEKVLIVGCKPWDNNAQDFKDQDKIHFVDCTNYDDGISIQNHPRFHHFDFNDVGKNSAGKFSEFAEKSSGQFGTIMLDWKTYHHIQRDEAWLDFSNLLPLGGKLIVPVFDGKRAQVLKLIINLHAPNFNKFEDINYTDMVSSNWSGPSICLDFLRRKGSSFDEIGSSNSVVIIATKDDS